MIKAGVIGATGYAGQQLVSLLIQHPEAEVAFVSSNSYAGQLFSDIYPQYLEVLDMPLLSTEEAAKYFDEDDRWASPTKAALKEASANDAPDYEWYWLRTPGQNGRYVAGISADGGIRYGGYSEGSYGYVRPAIWIDP